MTSVIIVGIVAVFAAFEQVMILKAFYYGVKIGRTKEEIVPEPFTAPKKRKKAKEVAKQTQKMNDILRNIDVYDGTSLGQKEIERGRAD